MNRLVNILFPTLVVSSLIAAPPAKKTEIPVGLQSAIEATRQAVEPDDAGFKGNNPTDQPASNSVSAVRAPTSLREALTAAHGPIASHNSGDDCDVASPSYAAASALSSVREPGHTIAQANGADTWHPLDGPVMPAKLTAPDGAAGDYFGRWVAINRDTVLIGAHGDDSCRGSAYVFVRNGATWTQQAKLTASDGVEGDVFGRAVALSGDIAVVGAFFANNQEGAAYVFVRNGTTWTQQAKLTAPDSLAGDRFGRSVAVSGNTIVVGAHGYDNDRGSAYAFVGSGGTWILQARLTPSDGMEGDYFGRAVAIDDDTMLVGSFWNGGTVGAAYVFVRNGATWTQQAKLTASDGMAGDDLGYAVALSGDTALTGALGANNLTGASYVFVRNGATWTQQAKLTASDGIANDSFGYAVALSGDTAVVGALHDDSFKGSAYVFQRGATAWTLNTKLTAPDGVANDCFGYAVALDGDSAVAGAYFDDDGKGSAYVFVVQPNVLTISPSTGSPFATLTLTGSGFSPNETVSFTYVASTRNVPLGTGSADAGGAFTAMVRFPLAPYGSGLVRAAGQDSGLSGAASFSVTPRLIMNPNAGPVGSSVVAQGFGFGAGETVKIQWMSLQQFLGTATADSTGSFYQGTGLTFTIPVGAPAGTNVVAGKGQTTLAVGKGYVTVQ